jgi:tRNA threonylcarbamoyl adenosine modification protein YeaZ/ribosomal-protein-alanine acetyltransferase
LSRAALPKPNIVLALDTSQAACSACVYDSAHSIILAEECEIMDRGHAEALPPMVARLMAQAGVAYADLNRIAVTTGPGTFTGIRIGLSFASALGLSLGCEVVGVNSLLACQVAVNETKLPVFVAQNAGNSGFIHFMNLDTSINIELFNNVQLPQEPCVVIGTAAAALVAASGRTDLILMPNYDVPKATGFAPYAAQLPAPQHMPAPLYLREADAKPQTAPLRQLPEFKIQVAGAEDAAVLAKLHATSFPQPWNEAAFTTLLQSPNCAALLAKTAGEPVGLLLYRVVVDEAEILTFCIDPNLRRRGAGLALLNAVLALKLPHMFLEVASQNSDAIQLYKSAGFAQVGLRKAYYETTGDDALILRRSAS